MENEKNLKRYYSISEVAEMFEVSKSLVRFWETEFDTLKPAKNSKGDRRFTPQNIEQIRQIYHLVKERGFTLNGAKQEIESLKVKEEEKKKVVKQLTNLKEFLENLKLSL
jgi:DNA-binding transcriptional MerR regulator